MKTFKIPAPKDYGLPRNRQQTLTHKIELYSLFRKNTVTNKWDRVSEESYTPHLACRVFSKRLAQSPLVYSIRPIKIQSDKAEGETKHKRPHYIEVRDSPSLRLEMYPWETR